MTETDLSLYFANPATPDQKRYEALRALLFEKLSKIEVMEKFGYTEYTLQALVRDFGQGKLIFFHPKKPGPKERSTSIDIQTKIVSLRKQNLSAVEIKEKLSSENIQIGLSTIERILADQGFVKLLRRTNKDRGVTKKKTTIPEKSHQFEVVTIRPNIYYFLYNIRFLSDIDHQFFYVAMFGMNAFPDNTS